MASFCKARVITFFFTNFPSGKSFEELKKFFMKVGDVCDVFIPQKKNRLGKAFGFVRFKGTENVYALEEKLNNLRVEDCCLRANVARFERRRMKNFKGCYSSASTLQGTLPRIKKPFIAAREQNEHLELEQVQRRLVEIKLEVEECLAKLDMKLFSSPRWLCSRCSSKDDILVRKKEYKNLNHENPDVSGVYPSANEVDDDRDVVIVTPFNLKIQNVETESSKLAAAPAEEGDLYNKLSDQNKLVEKGDYSKVPTTEGIKENIEEEQSMLNVEKGILSSGGTNFQMKRKSYSRRKLNKKN